MSQSRSPGYPGMSLGDAIELAKKIHDSNRTNPIDREAAAKDMGYTGISGRSAKVLSDLSHFGLLEKAGKGGVRVTRLAVEILYPVSVESRRAALREAAYSPALFSDLRAHFSDGLPSENALRSYLMRNAFASVAIPPILNSFMETCRLLQQENVTESHGDSAETDAESEGSENGPQSGEPPPASAPPATPPAAPQQSREVRLMETERVIFVDEAAPGQYLKLIASGELDDTLLEALEDFTKRGRKRLAQLGPKKHDEGDQG